MADVTLKVGTDTGSYKEDLKALRDGLVAIRDENNNLTQEIKARSSEASKSEKQFTDALVNNNKELVNQKKLLSDLQNILEQSGKISANAFKVDALKTYNATLKDSSALIKTLNSINLKGLLSPAEIAKITTALNGTNNEFEALNAILDVTKSKLSNLDPDSAEFKQLTEDIQAAEAILATFNKEVDSGSEKQKSLKQQLRENTAALAEMKQRGLENTEEFKQLKAATGELYDTLSDTKDEIKQMGSDTRGLDHLIRTATLLTGTLQVAQGANALFGSESEEVQKALLKVTAAMSILNGLQAIQTELTKKDSVARGAAIALQKTWTWAIDETSVSLKVLKGALLATGIGALIVAMGFLIQYVNDYNKSIEEEADKQKKVADEMERTKNLLNDIASLSEEERNSRKGGLNDLKRELQLAEARGDSEVKLAALRKKIADEEINNLAVRFYTLQGYTKEQEKLQQQIFDKKTERDAKEIASEKKIAEERKKLLDKHKEEAKKLNEDITAFVQQAEDNRIAAINDANDRESAENINAFEKEIAALQDKYTKIINTQILSDEQRKQLKESYEKQLNDIAAKYAIKAIEIEKKHNDDRLQAVRDGYDAIYQIDQSAHDKEIQSVDDKYAQIRLRIQKAGLLNAEIEKSITDASNKEKAEVDLKYSLQRLDKKRELEVAEIEIATNYKGTRAKIEELKQVEIIKVQLKYAKMRLAALEATGGDENALAIAQAKKLVSSLKQTLSTSLSKDSPIADALGTTDEEIMSITGKAKNIFDSIDDIYAQSIQRKIDLKQREIDTVSSQLDIAEKELDREIQLRDKGYAANVAGKQREVDALKRQRDKDLEDQKRNQKELAKVEILKQGSMLATSVAELILTASKILSSNVEDFGWVGAFTGLAEAAAVVAGFVSLRNSIKNYQTLGDGGEIEDGRSHTDGGNKYLSIDGNSMVEIEKGEFVTNKKSTNKYLPVLKAINDDSISNWTYADVMKYMAPSDIQFDGETPRQIVLTQNMVNANNNSQISLKGNEYLADIATTNRMISESNAAMAEGTIRERDGRDLIIISGNNIRRIKEFYKNDRI